HAPLCARAVRWMNINLILARTVAQVCDPASIRRPRGRKLAHALRVCQVAYLTFFRWRGKDIATRAEECTRAARRDGEGLDVCLHIFRVGISIREIAIDLDGDALFFAGLRVEPIDVTARFIDQLIA